jgi:hypothetical protein
MDDMSRKDIRRILKTFGISADEAMVAHLARNPSVDELSIRVTLEDLTDYGDSPPDERLNIVINDNVRRSQENKE